MFGRIGGAPPSASAKMFPRLLRQHCSRVCTRRASPLTAVYHRGPLNPCRQITRSAVVGAEGGGGGRKKPKAVIFDLGGVIAPSPWPIFNRFEERCGLKNGSVVDTIRKMGDDGAFARMERGEITTGQFCEPFSKEYTAHTGQELTPEQVAEFMRELGGELLELMVNPETLAAIEGLRRRGIKTAVLTNNFRHDDGTTVLPKEKLNVDVVCVPPFM